MGKSKLLIYILTGLLLCTAIFAGIKGATNDQPLYAIVSSGAQTEELSVWYDTYYGMVYVFLPGYAEMDQVQLKTSRDHAYQIGPYSISDGMSCEAFQLEVPYPVTARENFPYDGKQLMFVRSGGVSTLFLDVRSGSMEYLHEDKTHDEPGTIRLYGEDGSLLYSGSADAVSGRGQSSWLDETKKPYNITLQEEVDLLGMGSAEKWCLLANAKDASHLRNKAVFELADAAGIPYSSDSQWVDLYLNGEYAGLYLLCERIEVHPERVAISEEGSFLVTKDYPDRLDTYFTTNDNASLGILYSDFSTNTLQSYWQAAENAILAEDGMDPVTGKSWQELIDPESWVKKFLLEETFGNIDAPVLSQYFYLDGEQESSRICASPPWDYEVAMTRPANAIHVYRNNIYGSYWNWALYQKPEFYDLLMQEYASVFRPLLLDLAENGLSQYASQIAEAADMNRCRWGVTGFEDSVSSVKDYILQRVAFLDTVWLEEREYVTVYILGLYSSVYAYLQEPGSVLPELRSYDDDTGILPLGWYYEGTDIPVDPEAPLFEDTTVVFRWEELPEDAVLQASNAESEPIPRSRFLAILVFLIMLAAVAAADLIRFRKIRTPKRISAETK